MQMARPPRPAGETAGPEVSSRTTAASKPGGSVPGSYLPVHLVQMGSAVLHLTAASNHED